MPKIRRRKHERKIPQDEDVVIKIGKLRIYFQNYYTIISLVNDVLLGGLFLIGSIATILDATEWIRQWSYLIGSFFMLMRPILKILRNIFIYDKEEFREKVTDPRLLGEKTQEKKTGSTQNQDFSGDNYTQSKSQNEKMEEIERQEKENK